jgi:hypothetical protein
MQVRSGGAACALSLLAEVRDPAESAPQSKIPPAASPGAARDSGGRMETMA